MEPLGRRAFLLRGAGLIAAAVPLHNWQLVGEALEGVDPRLRALARAVSGPVITPSTRTYGQARRVYNERFDAVHPLGIVQPVSIDDVRRILAWARKTRVHLAIRSGTHCYAGYSTTEGLVVDLKRLDSIKLTPSGNAAIGAGARLIDIEATLAGRGRAIPGGSCATVGIGGFALGGGVGFLSRKFGTASDNIVSLGIVTADGLYRACSASENPDLYWACRGGGGGNFGIVTDFLFQTHPVAAVSYFFADWPWEQAAEVVRAWQVFAPHAPDEFFSVCALETGVGSPSVRAFGQLVGPERKLRTLVKPLTHVAGLRLTLGSSSYLDAQLRWAGCLGKSVAQCHLAGDTPAGTLQRASFAAKSDYLDAPPSRGAADLIVEWIERAQHEGFGSAALLLDSYGGAINRIPRAATAFVHRNALCSGQYLAYWSRPSRAPAAVSWIRSFYKAMRPYVSGFAYQNYIDPDLTSWRHAYYGTNYGRLREVKGRFDSEWLFRFPQGIELPSGR